MKRLLVVLLLVAGLAVFALANFSNKKKSTGTVNKTEKKTEKPKKQCRHTCPFS